MGKRRWHGLWALILLVGGTGLAFSWMDGLSVKVVMPVTAAAPPAETQTPRPSSTATEPILPQPPTAAVNAGALAVVPTPVRAVAGSVTATLSSVTAGLAIPAVPSVVAASAPVDGLLTLQQRLGVAVAGAPVTGDLARQLGFGWYLDWSPGPARFRPAGVQFVPMIRLTGGVPTPSGDALLAAVDAQRGALWLIGNEPDVKWQDNVSAEEYAQLYHDLYQLLKARDPTCQVAIGGVAQPTPLRLRYLDRILQAYEDHFGEPMPVDVWNIHNFILREERNSWGVDIPPGMDEQSGELYEIGDHDDLAIFQNQMWSFRRWMKERGQRDKPLIVTEYGILMPTDYGFPPEAVQAFMLGTFDFFRTAADPTLGYPEDGGRLVQRWCWFSLADVRYPTGNLLVAASGQLTPLGKAYGRYAHPQ